MDRKNWNRLGLAAVILLAPGGFILGATLAAKKWRDLQSADDRADAPAE